MVTLIVEETVVGRGFDDVVDCTVMDEDNPSVEISSSSNVDAPAPFDPERNMEEGNSVNCMKRSYSSDLK